MGGRAGAPPGPAPAPPMPGPSSTCFCWLRCISSIWARSVSKMTGANNITELVKKIHEALHEKLYRPLTLRCVRCVTPPQKFRTPSGNISVKPHNRSPRVSSGSWKEVVVVSWSWGDLYATYIVSIVGSGHGECVLLFLELNGWGLV